MSADECPLDHSWRNINGAPQGSDVTVMWPMANVTGAVGSTTPRMDSQKVRITEESTPKQWTSCRGDSCHRPVRFGRAQTGSVRGRYALCRDLVDWVCEGNGKAVDIAEVYISLEIL